MLGATVLDPLAWARPLKAGLGRDHKADGIWMKRLGDKTLANFRPVRVGGVDEIDSQFHCAPQYGDRLGMVGRFAPDAVAGELHRTKTESVNEKIAADYESSAPDGRSRIGGMLSRGDT